MRKFVLSLCLSLIFTPSLLMFVTVNGEAGILNFVGVLYTAIICTRFNRLLPKKLRSLVSQIINEED